MSLSLPIVPGTYKLRNGRIITVDRIEYGLYKSGNRQDLAYCDGYASTGRATTHTPSQKDIVEGPLQTPHPHADLMLAFAKDAQTSNTPWEFWEFYVTSQKAWFPCIQPPRWSSHRQYRRKPQTIRIGEFDVPAPLTDLPENGQSVFFPSFGSVFFPSFGSASNDGVDRLEVGYYHETANELLALGLLHSTHEAALIHSQALTSFTKK